MGYRTVLFEEVGDELSHLEPMTVLIEKVGNEHAHK
jgi:hypothetical protein